MGNEEIEKQDKKDITEAYVEKQKRANPLKSRSDRSSQSSLRANAFTPIQKTPATSRPLTQSQVGPAAQSPQSAQTQVTQTQVTQSSHVTQPTQPTQSQTSPTQQVPHNSPNEEIKEETVPPQVLPVKPADQTHSPVKQIRVDKIRLMSKGRIRVIQSDESMFVSCKHYLRIVKNRAYC